MMNDEAGSQIRQLARRIDDLGRSDSNPDTHYQPSANDDRNERKRLAQLQSARHWRATVESMIVDISNIGAILQMENASGHASRTLLKSIDSILNAGAEEFDIQFARESRQILETWQPGQEWHVRFASDRLTAILKHAITSAAKHAERLYEVAERLEVPEVILSPPVKPTPVERMLPMLSRTQQMIWDRICDRPSVTTLDDIVAHGHGRSTAQSAIARYVEHGMVIRAENGRGVHIAPEFFGHKYGIEQVNKSA